MNAIITEIKARGNLLLNLNNQVIPPDAPVWQMNVDKAVDGTEAAMFPAAFAVDDPEAAGLDVKILFPNGDSGEEYRLTLLIDNNIPLFRGKAQPADKADNADKNEKNIRRFSLALQYRPHGFFKFPGIKLSWRLVNENTQETLDLPSHLLELYWLFKDSSDLFQRGVSVEVLRDFTCHLEKEAPPGPNHEVPLLGHASEKVMTSVVVTWVFYRVPPRYDICEGQPSFAFSYGTGYCLRLTQYLFATDDDKHCCNCIDMAAVVQALLHLIGIKDVAYVYIYPFGFLKETQLIGRGECNNPLYGKHKSRRVVDEYDPDRSYFNYHYFCVITGGMVLDACTGPHTGTEPEGQYLKNAIDPHHPFIPGYRPGTIKDIHFLNGVVKIDLMVAPKKLIFLPFTKEFMKKLGISVNRFSKKRNKYVVYSWPGPLHCPALSDQPWELFYSGIINGQGEVVKTWKLKQEVKKESIHINVHIFSGSKKSALYRFIELGSASSAPKLPYGKGDPGLGQYSAQSIDPCINRRYFWVYYNMIIDIMYYNSTADADAVNKWFQQQAESHLKDSINAYLPSVDDILCDNLAPKVGETVTVSMNPSSNINHDFIIKGQGLRLRQETPHSMSFQARKVGNVKLGILAVDKNTLLMKTKPFNIKIQ